MAKKLYVGNLSYDVTDAELSQLFGQCGRVTGVKVIKDKTTGKSKGFAFVEMSNDEEAMHAIQRLGGQDLMGRQISVSEARETNGDTHQGHRSAGGGRR